MASHSAKHYLSLDGAALARTPQCSPSTERPAAVALLGPRASDLPSDRSSQSVTTAMGELVRAGTVSRRDDGHWGLHGDPPSELRHHRVATLS
jgi:hypothetical protein